MKNKKIVLYLVKVFSMPIIILTVIVFIISIIDINIKNDLDIFIFKINVGKFSNVLTYISKFVAFIISSGFSIRFIRKLNSDKIFLDKNIYGCMPKFVFFIANFIGYKKILARSLPYYIQIPIILNKKFDLIGLEEGLLKKEIEYEVDYSKYSIISNLNEINLIISDTYEIGLENLPKCKHIHSTIIIKRKHNERGRIYCEKLDESIKEVFGKLKINDITINLFLTINNKTCKIMTESIFGTCGRDKYKLKIYQQDMTNKKFKEKFYRLTIK